MNQDHQIKILGDVKEHIFPGGYHFKCRMCGRCCIDPNQIRLTRSDYQRLGNIDWQSHQDSAAPSLSIVYDPQVPTHPYWVTSRGNACYFLQSGKRCLIKNVFGYHAKPVACRRFPFLPRGTPEGIYLGLDFTCTAILQNYGDPLASIPYLDLTPLQYHLVGTSISVNDIHVSWPAYKNIEKRLDIIIDSRERPLDHSLMIGYGLFKLIDNLARRFDKKPPDEIVETVLEIWDRSVGNKLEEETKSKFAQSRFSYLAEKLALDLAAKKMPPDMLKLRIPSSAREWWQVDLDGNTGRGIKKSGLKRKSNASLRDLLNCFSSHGFGWEISGRYLKHVLFRKDLALADDSRQRYTELIFYYALIQLYAIVNASEKKSHVLNEEDVLQAVAMVELHHKYPPLHDQLTRSQLMSHMSSFCRNIWSDLGLTINIEA